MSVRMPRVFKAGYALAGYQESSEDEESATPAAGHEAPPRPPPCTRCPAASAQALLIFAIVAVVSSAAAVVVIFQIARHQSLVHRVAASFGERARAFFGGFNECGVGIKKRACAASAPRI